MKRNILFTLFAILCTCKLYSYYNVNGIWYSILRSSSTSSVYYAHVEDNSPTKVYYKGNIVIPSEISTTIIEGRTGKGVTCSVKGISHEAFSLCDSLQSILFPTSLVYIGEEAFSDCSLLTTVHIPQNVSSIGYASVSTTNDSVIYSDCGYAFSKCTNLKNIYVYRPTKFNACIDFRVGGTTSEYSYNFISNDTHTTVWYAAVDCNVTAAGPKRRFVPEAFEVVEKRLYFSTSFSLPPYPEYPNRHVTSVSYGDEELEAIDSVYTITNLYPGSQYPVTAIVHDDDTDLDYTFEFYVKTKALSFTLSARETQNSVTATVSATNKNDAKYSEVGIYFKGIYYPANNNGEVTLSGLKPNTTYKMYAYAVYNGNKIVSNESTKITTKGLSPTIKIENTYPTCIKLRGEYTIIDATIDKTGFTNHTEGDVLTLTGLDPSTKYTIEYYVKTKEGSNEKVTTTFTTPALEMTTLNPKVVSNSCAIVAATTNMSDEETNAGFQWRKYEAPETLPSSEGYAAIYDGQLEGYIKNLQATSFYNVRAFYKSTAGKYYYSDWVTFDPSDFSYFEPTVHTYPTEELTANSAKVKGYVLQGTDAITEQGFVYWPTGTNKAYATRSVTVPENASIVIAKGQVMNVTLEGLTPSTTYNFCAFVTTASGTIYGEEHSFTTKADETGIELLESEQPTPTIIGYYDLNGRKLSEPQHGITIVRYSDGTARKILTE